MDKEKRTKFLENVNQQADRLEKLKSLFPEIFADEKLNIEALKDLCSANDEQDSDESGFYGLTWNGKRAARRAYKQPASGTLKISGGGF